MQKNPVLYLFISLIILFSGCTNTFMGSVLVLTFSDVVFYIFIAFILGILTALFNPENRKRSFWTWFLLSLILTPLAGFINLLIKVSNNK